MTKSLRRIEVLARSWGRAALAAGALLALTLTQTIAVAIQPGNVDTVLNQNNTYGTLWLKPSSILQPRFFKFSVKLQF